MRHYAVYRFFTVDGELLYVGCTGRLPERLIQHSGKPWWAEVATVAVEHFAHIDPALRAENRAITSEAPKYNVQPSDIARGGWATRRQTQDALHAAEKRCQVAGCRRCPTTSLDLHQAS